MAFYLWDILNDACLVFRYHYAGYKYYCCITLIFLVVPGMFMSFLSNDWYAKDEEEFAPVSKSKWKSVFRVVCRIILIWPLARYVDSLCYGIESIKAQKMKDFPKMDQCLQQMTYLRLVECFFESAPQLVLKFYIIAIHECDLFNTHVVLVVCSFFISLVSLALTLTLYEKSKTEENDQWRNTFYDTFLLGLACFCWISSRVIVLGFFAAYCFPVLRFTIIIVPLPIFIHLCCKFKAKRKEELTFGKVVFYAITALIHVFAFVNERKKVPGPPRPPQIPYLLVISFETLFYVIIVLMHGKFDQEPSDPLPWFYSVAIASGLGLHGFSWLLLAIYYRHSLCKKSTDEKSTDERPQSTIFTDEDGEIFQYLSVNGVDSSPMSRPTPTQSLAIIAAKKIV
ncbi:uncharacterized protein LOC124210048 isoform X2 [Daphnia pulex]|uniref:uncharacterized protein LOC124210048 isoform X2 n=1 Tax=Daphnia pulex TaxID=6669 RepID=UPI001EDCEFEF|nr:uncharacterized protein LOC124210048 isoform X2 [Daphnia pulex]